MSPVWRKALPLPTTEEIAREFVVKTSLTKGLGQEIKRLQQNLLEPQELIINDEVTTSICYILEAIFIHGLKDTFIRRVTAILSGNVDKIPEPNFWPFLLIFSHKNVITHIQNLTNITTEIGHCRAWLRVALNDGLLESYLSAMLKDKKSLQYYYSQTAYLRDTEQPDILRKYFETLSLLNFKLDCDIQKLNEWSPKPLVLAGIWAPPIAPEPVITGVDIASYFSDDGNLITPIRRRELKTRESELDSANGECSELPSCSSTQQINFNTSGSAYIEINNLPLYAQESCSSSPASCPDPPTPIQDYNRFYENAQTNDTNNARDDNFYRNIESIEETVVHDVDDSASENTNNRSDERQNSERHTPSTVPQTPSDVLKGISDGVPEAEMSEDLNNHSHMGNSLIGKSGWSSSCDDDNVNEKENSVQKSESFNTLLKNYSPASGSVIGTPNFSDIIDMPGINLHENARTSPTTPAEDPSMEVSGFEVIPRKYSVTSKHIDSNTQAMVDLIGKIQNEKGVNSQNFQCKGCSRPVGMIYGTARVCGYTGGYYCTECHENDEYVIPARVIHNWDFRKYKVAKSTLHFLEQVEEEPLIDIRKLNHSLYSAIEEMEEILNLRTKLNYLRSYLFTCRESVVEKLRKKVWPKEYLYEHIHLYAISDLKQIPGGNFAQVLTKVINFATKHVAECRLCSQKGFVCEVCNNPKVIYPFEIDVTYRCDVCLAVYHDTCMNSKKPCPKCDRKKKHSQGHQECLWSMEY